MTVPPSSRFYLVVVMKTKGRRERIMNKVTRMTKKKAMKKQTERVVAGMTDQEAEELTSDVIGRPTSRLKRILLI
jgi:hypothetical protein